MTTEIFPKHMRLAAAALSAMEDPAAMDTVLVEADNDRAERHERVAAASGRQVPTPDAQASHAAGSNPDWRSLR